MRISACISLVLLFTLGGAFSVSAQVEWSGFFDILYTDSQERGDGTFDYGQFEVDLAVSLSECISAEGALAYNADEGFVELGAGFVDFHLFGSEEGHLVRRGVLTHSGLIVGQFDVPFGIDYRVIPSVDRKLVTPPLVNQMTIDCWNDWGIQLYGVTDRANGELFGVNGSAGGQAIGGRIGVTPTEQIEVGGSYAFDMSGEGEVASTVLGVDAGASWNALSVKGEYIMAEDDKAEDVSWKHTGFYVQGTYDLEEATGHPAFVSLRYGAWSPDDDAVDGLDRLTVGLGYRIVEGVEIRCELQKNGEENEEIDDDRIAVQLVVGY